MRPRSRSFAADGRASWRRGAVVALAVVVAAALLGLTWRRPTRAAGRRAVAVLDLARRTPSGDDAWPATALADIVSVTLGHSERLRVLDGDRVAEAVRQFDPRAVAGPDAATLAKLRRTLGADLVVTGSYAAADADAGPLDLELRAYDGAGRVTVARGSGSGLFAATIGVAQQLRRQLGDALDDQDARAVLAMMPASVAVAHAYADGLSRWRRGRVAEAREHFERAVAGDPQYAAAQLALARAQAWLGYERRAREAAGRASAVADGLPRVERLAIAAYAAELDGDCARAIELRATSWAAAPDDVDVGLRLAAAQVACARFADALTTVAPLRGLGSSPSDDGRVELVRSRAWVGLADYDRAAAAGDAAQRRARADGDELAFARAAAQTAVALALRGDCARAEELAEDARSRFAERADWRGASECSDVLLDCRARRQSPAEVHALLAQSLAQAEWSGRPRALVDALVAHAPAADAATAQRELERALALARDLEDRLGADAIATELARLALARGDLDDARRQLEPTIAATRRDGDLAQLVGQLALLADLRARAGDAAGARQSRDEQRALVERLARRGAATSAAGRSAR